MDVVYRRQVGVEIVVDIQRRVSGRRNVATEISGMVVLFHLYSLPPETWY